MNPLFTLREPTRFDRIRHNALYAPSRHAMRRVPPLDGAQSAVVEALRRDGQVVMEDRIPPDKLAVLQAEFAQALADCKFDTPCLAQNRIDPERHKTLIQNHLLATPSQLASAGLAFQKHEVSSYSQVLTDFRPSTLTAYMLETSETYRSIWFDPYLLTISAHYMGLVPRLAEAYVRRNFPADYRVMNHYWHRDLNSPICLLKMFIFLSDCEMENGPHEYVLGSHRALQVLNGRRYYTDEEVDAAYPLGSEKRFVSVVRAGTIILEDTRGLHRAQVPVTGHRDMGFAVFLPLRPFYRHRNYALPPRSLEIMSDLQRLFVLPSSVSKT